MNQCWSYHSKDRPSFAQCLETLEKIQKSLIDSTKVITCVHNQNYSFERKLITMVMVLICMALCGW